MDLRSLFSGRGRVLVVAAAVVAFAVLWLVWGNRGSDRALGTKAPARGMPVSVDRPAPEFTRPMLSEPGSLSLRRYDGKILVVNFWASWCAPCRSEVPELERVWRAFRARGVRFVSVNYEDGRKAALDFARSHQMTYPSVIDANGSVGDDYGIFGLPTTYIVAPGDRIRFVINGEIHPASFRQALESLLSGSEPADP